MKYLIWLCAFLPTSAFAEYTGDYLAYVFRPGTPGGSHLYAVDMPIDDLRGLKLDQKVRFYDVLFQRTIEGTYQGPEFSKGTPRAVLRLEGEGPTDGLGTSGTGPGPGTSAPGAGVPGPSGLRQGQGAGSGLGAHAGAFGRDVLATGVAGWAFEQLSHLSQAQVFEVQDRIHGEQQKYERGIISFQKLQKSILDMVVEAGQVNGGPRVSTDIPSLSHDGYKVRTSDPDFRRALVQSRNALRGFRPKTAEQAKLTEFALQTTIAADSYFFKGHIPVTEETVQFLVALGDVVFGYNPVTSFMRSFHDLITGRDFITGHPLNDLQKSLALFDIVTLGFGSKIKGRSKIAIELFNAGRDFVSHFELGYRGGALFKEWKEGRGPLLQMAYEKSTRLQTEPGAVDAMARFRDYYRAPYRPLTQAPSGIAKMLIETYHTRGPEGISATPASLLRRDKLSQLSSASENTARRWEKKVSELLKSDSLSTIERHELEWIQRDLRGALGTNPYGDLP